MNIQRLITDLCGKTAVCGFEYDFSIEIEKHFKNMGLITEIDKFNNVYGLIKGTEKDNKTILIDAHIDEIGLMVKKIDENGFLKFTLIGGVDCQTLLSKEVTIHSKEKIFGVIGAKPPHLQKEGESDKPIKIDDLFIDVGMSFENAKNKISVGDIITINSKVYPLLNNEISSKALDNRAGLTCLMLILNSLKNQNLKNDVLGVASVQEELGLVGAKISSYKKMPNLAIVIDVTHGISENVSCERASFCGGGPVIAIGPNLCPVLSKKIIEIAKKNNIKYQIEVEAGSTGTNAWAIQVSKEGVPTILVSIPLKYMHTSVETISIDDAKKCADLIVKFILDIETGVLI